MGTLFTSRNPLSPIERNLHKHSNVCWVERFILYFIAADHCRTHQMSLLMCHIAFRRAPPTVSSASQCLTSPGFPIERLVCSTHSVSLQSSSCFPWIWSQCPLLSWEDGCRSESTLVDPERVCIGSKFT